MRPWCEWEPLSADQRQHLKDVCLHAQKSRQLGQNYISPEHIVLALFTTGDSSVQAVIGRCVSDAMMQMLNSPPTYSSEYLRSVSIGRQWKPEMECSKGCVCRLGVTNGEKIIKAKAVERLKGDSETTEQRKTVTVRALAQAPCSLALAEEIVCRMLIQMWQLIVIYCRCWSISAEVVATSRRASGNQLMFACADGVREARLQQDAEQLLQRPLRAGAQ